MKLTKKHQFSFGFTIVEILIVITVIGILATIIFISYKGATSSASAAVLQNDLKEAAGQLVLEKASSGLYPVSIAAAGDGKGLAKSADTNYIYLVDNTSNPARFCLDGMNKNEHYRMGSEDRTPVKGGCNLLAGDSSMEKIGSNEFLQYADLAPIFDTYGIREYTISFNIRSSNTATQNTTQVYMQNGSTARYSFSVSVPVTMSYARQSITVTPALSNPSVTQSMLAFYGTYGTGNISSVKNVKVEFGNKASDWSPGF